MPLFSLFLASAVLAGLGLSLVGDVALMFPQGFLAGLVAFLLAHLAYLVAFTRGGVRLAARPGPFIAYTLLASLILAVLWPGVPAGLRAPVVAYVLCLAAMAAQAAVRWRCCAVVWTRPWRNAPRWAACCSCARTRCWPSTASTRRCRRRRCGCWPPTGRLSTHSCRWYPSRAVDQQRRGSVAPRA